MFVKVTIWPEDWYPLEMKLIISPVPGFPNTWAIACRRSKEIPPLDERVYICGEDRFGEWEQPIPNELARRILARLAEARIPPMTEVPERPWMCDGPPTTNLTVELPGVRFVWTSWGTPPGWEPLRDVIRLMALVVHRARPIAPRVNYFFRRDT